MSSPSASFHLFLSDAHEGNRMPFMIGDAEQAIACDTRNLEISKQLLPAIQKSDQAARGVMVSLNLHA